MSQFITGLLTLLLAAGSIDAAQPAKQAASVEPERERARQLVFTIDPGKERYVLYEPVVITYNLSNPTSLVARSEVLFRFTDFTVQYEDLPPHTFPTGPEGCVLPPEGGHVHAPGETTSDSITMFFNYATNDLAFARTGVYTIRGRIFVGNLPNPTYIDSSPVSIVVDVPGPIDQQVLDHLGSPHRLVALLKLEVRGYCGERACGECSEDLRNLYRRSSASAYAPHIAFSLAEEFSSSGPDRARGDISEAARDLTGFLTRWPEHPLAPNVMAKLIYTLMEEGRKGEAATWFQRFAERHASRREILRELEANVRRQ